MYVCTRTMTSGMADINNKECNI